MNELIKISTTLEPQPVLLSHISDSYSIVPQEEAWLASKRILCPPSPKQRIYIHMHGMSVSIKPRTVRLWDEYTAV